MAAAMRATGANLLLHPTVGESAAGDIDAAVRLRCCRAVVGEFPPDSVRVLDGDAVRPILSAGLGYSRADRDANVRRVGFVAAEIARAGGTALCALIAPYDGARREVRDAVRAAGGAFLLVHVATTIAVCEARDAKGLYTAARSGRLPAFTGVSDPYEPPADAEISVDLAGDDPRPAVEKILARLADEDYLPATAAIERPAATPPA